MPFKETEATVNNDDTLAQRPPDARRATANAEASKPDGLLPLPRWNSGGHLVNIDNREELRRAMAEGVGTAIRRIVGNDGYDLQLPSREPEEPIDFTSDDFGPDDR